MQKLPSCVLFTGFAILIAGAILGWVAVPKLVERSVSEKVKLVNGTETFEKWKDVKVPIFVKFYLFNVTNPHEIVSGGKPILQEIGPFTYRQKRLKVNIKIDKRNDTLSYKQILTYFFEPELSIGSLREVLTVLNIPFLGVMHKAARQSTFIRSLILQLVEEHHESVFIQRTVAEMLFQGYYVPFMDDLASVTGEALLLNNTFGLQYNKNGTDQGLFEVYSGSRDTSKFGIIRSYEGSSEMPWWEDKNCRKIKGTDGSIFPPFVTKDRKLDMFSADLCRSLTLIYDTESNVDGVPAYRFVVDPHQLEDPIFNRDNMCYCTQQGERFSNCPKTGAYQINACKKETPLLISLPHFLDGASEYLNATQGLQPNKDLHETFIELEPTSGLLVRGHKRIQINIELRSFKFSKKFKKVRNMLFPLMWLDESAEMTPETKERVKGELIKALTYSNYGAWTSIALGLLIIAIAVLIYLIRARRKNYGT